MYAKIFSSIFTGSLRGQSDELLVFVNLLVTCDEEGFVDKHFNVISDETGLTGKRVRQAILNLEGPDKDSRSPNEEGRRIERIDDHRDWGWHIVNYEKYRMLRNKEERKKQNREAQKRYKEKRKNTPMPVSMGKHESAEVSTGKQRSAESAQAEAEEEANKKITQHSKENVATKYLEFEKAWNLYPARNGKKLLKAEAKALFLKIRDIDIPLVLTAIQNYASSKGVLDGYAKDMVRFLRNNRWREWLTQETNQQPTSTPEPYPGNATTPWQPPADFKSADPEIVKKTLEEMKNKLFHQKPESLKLAKPRGNKQVFVVDTERELLLAQNKKSDDRRKLNNDHS